MMMAPALAYEWFCTAADQWNPFTKGLVSGVCGTLAFLILLCGMAMFSY